MTSQRSVVPDQRDNRKVTIEVRDPSGNVLVRQNIEYDDQGYRDDGTGNAAIGAHVYKHSYVRNTS